MRFSELKLSAHTAYAELFEQARGFEMTSALAGLKSSFQKLERKGKRYWYFAYRDTDQKTRMAYVGPDDSRVQALIARFAQMQQDKPLAPAARSAIALGCTPAVPKHFRIIKRLSEYGFSSRQKNTRQPGRVRSYLWRRLHLLQRRLAR